MNTLKRATQAAEYRVRAQEASALADASPLGHVRAKHTMAAARWIELALLNEPAAAAHPPAHAPMAGLAPIAIVTGG
jgi:hypothetical protein